MMGMNQAWANVGSTIATLMFMWAIIDKFIPSNLKASFSQYTSKFITFFNPYIHIKIPEYTGEFSTRNEAYVAVEAYLTANSSNQARNLRADINMPNQKLSLTIDAYEEVVDVFRGTKIWWFSGKTVKTNTLSFSCFPDREERRYYRLTFHARNRKLITESYLPNIINEGRAIRAKGRRKKLFTNNASNPDTQNRRWSSVLFDHPATFDTLAMDPIKKKEIMDDLTTFRKRKDYYEKIGKAWKRGYLLYGPPGTGKSSMVAAMANFLDYDVYDLELTAVKDNTELRKLLFDTASKSIIVIEDIDCSVDHAGKRINGNGMDMNSSSNNEESSKLLEKKQILSKVTLSGVLNFIDGLWSACGGERIVVFTTNHIEKLDPALIRSGRMIMHIVLSYCSFKGFKLLANNYLGVESHSLFERIEELIQEVKITPADVAENLMTKIVDEDVDECLKNLVDILVKVKGLEAASNEDEEISSDENAVGDNNGSEASL